MEKSFQIISFSLITVGFRSLVVCRSICIHLYRAHLKSNNDVISMFISVDQHGREENV